MASYSQSPMKKMLSVGLRGFLFSVDLRVFYPQKYEVPMDLRDFSFENNNLLAVFGTKNTKKSY